MKLSSLTAITMVTVAMSAFAGCGAKEAAPATAPVTVTATATATATETAIVAAPTKATPKPAPAAADHWMMPNQVGKELQASQDRIQAISGDPLFYTSSEDASGQGRFQVLDRDWHVCSQRPAAGTTFNADTNITFYVVKYGENCP